MKSITTLTVLSAAGALAAPGASCPRYTLISARGTGEPQGPSQGFTGMIKQTLGSIPGGVEYDVVYPAENDVSQQTTYIGSKDILRYISQGMAACPQQVYALLGYSQGATVVLEAIKNITGTSMEPLVKAVVFDGNPYQVKDQKSTVDENGGASTRGNDGILLKGFLGGIGSIPGIGLSQHWDDSGKALNICFTGDPVCNGISYGISSPAHLAYPFSASVQKEGGDHLVSKLR